MAHLPSPPAPAPDWAWFLDVDGTLIDIAPTPSAISIPVELPSLLAAVARCHGGALALVSGRSLDNLAQLVAPFDPPAAGLHGIERRNARGEVVRPDPPAGLDAIRDRLAMIEQWPGVLLEDKGLTLAVHYRQAAAREEDCRRLAEAVAADYPEFVVLHGKMVFELRPRGRDKGAALRDFMGEPPFKGRVPVFVGDDLTDESGFLAANELGGLSVLVGPLRETCASFDLPDIGSCRSWLARAAGTMWAPRMGEGAD